MTTCNPPCLTDVAVPLPKTIIAVLDKLQTEASDAIPGSIYVYDLVEQSTIHTSYSVAAMLGYTTAQTAAMEPDGLASLIHPDDLNRVSEHYQRFTTLRSEETIAIEYRMKQADGTWCCLRSQETPLVTAIDGFPLQILGLIQKIPQLSTTSIRYEKSFSH